MSSDSLTQAETDELYAFVSNLSEHEEWVFFHCAWAKGDGSRVTNEDKYAVMLKWETIIAEEPTP